MSCQTDTFEKPVLDTVFVNTYKMAVLMSHMPEEAKSWKEWQVQLFIPAHEGTNHISAHFRSLLFACMKNLQ
jgi:hypothetical protein